MRRICFFYNTSFFIANAFYLLCSASYSHYSRRSSQIIKMVLEGWVVNGRLHKGILLLFFLLLLFLHIFFHGAGQHSFMLGCRLWKGDFRRFLLQLLLLRFLLEASRCQFLIADFFGETTEETRRLVLRIPRGLKLSDHLRLYACCLGHWWLWLF